MSMTVLWLIAAAAFALLEAATVQLVSIWFAAGSIAGMIAAAFHGSIWLQLILFCTVSLLILIIVRPLTKKYLFPQKVATNADRVIGMHGIVIQTIDTLQNIGQVSVGGSVWTARTDGPPIEEGTKVTVLRIEGVKLFVMPCLEKGTDPSETEPAVSSKEKQHF